MGDPSQIGQIIMNLVLNAAESLGGSPGMLRITTSLYTLQKDSLPDALPAGSLAAGPHVCLEVSDTGSGMSPEVLARIFDPFFSTQFAGRGLGLAAVLGIVRTHHGGLTVSSTPGAGSTFRVYLPAAPVAATREIVPPMQPEESFLAGNGRILIADDDDAVRDLTSTLLVKLGYVPVSAHDGLEAVRLFSENPGGYSTVMLDITMPNLDGLSAMNQIRLLRPRVPVILFSGHSMQDTRRQVGASLFTDFLEKPFTIDRLRESLRRAIGTN
jgi:CheY-like chemotaxis protein